MAAEDGIEAGFVDDLLALQNREQQIERLRTAGLLDADGLDRLLDVARRLLNENPGKARDLAEVCAGLAEAADAPAAVPSAQYVLVQTHFTNGEFDVALRLVDSAYRGYMALGYRSEALRTNIGRMALLLELGRYHEALEAGGSVLDALEGPAWVAQAREAGLLAATVHLNRGGCFEYMGLYEEALSAYALAEDGYRSLDAPERVGEVLDNKGAVLSYLGRSTEALEAHKAAAAIFEASGFTLRQVMSLGNIGETHLRLGNYMDALGAFERARGLLGTLDASADEYLILRDTADAYLALNLYSEALALYREADHLLREAGMLHDRARALWGMGAAMAARSEYGEAEEALAEATRLFAEAENVPMISGVMLERASLLDAGGDREGALSTAGEALSLVSAGDWPVQEVYARLRLADLSLPDVERAEPHLLAAGRLSDRLALPQLRYRLDERLGHLRRLQGRDDEARAFLEAAVDEIERLRGAVVQDAMRASFLRDKTSAYEDLLLLDLDRGDEASVKRAFAVAERAKSRALLDLVTGVAEGGQATSADPELEGQLQTLQADLNAVYGEMLDGGAEGHPTALSDLRARAAELEQEISRLRLRSASLGSTLDPFATSAPPEDAWDRLPPDTVLLGYHTVGGEVLAFVCARGRVRLGRCAGTVAEVEKLSHKLDVQWERFRAGGRFAGRHMATLERSTRQILSALYRGLVSPLEPLVREVLSEASGPVPKLAVVPHGPLHRVPFHALLDDDGRYLIERFEISYAPSANLYALCQNRRMSDRNGTVVFGVDDPLIPAAAAEARSVAQQMPGSRTRLGEGATIGALRDEAPGSAILHLACHGLFRSDNPMFSALKLHDGWLTAADAMSLDVSDALVTLSACESGRSEVIGGDEVLGLTRAFLGAGVATLVVSLWLVQDETTADLMGDWYGRLRRGEGRTAALRAAQLELKERHPHPYYWAPFVLIGKR